MTEITSYKTKFDTARYLGAAARRKILEILETGPVDIGALPERLGLSRSAVRGHLRRLEKTGKIEWQRGYGGGPSGERSYSPGIIRKI
jgi:predicted ArsR family transcriptional regulator